MFFKFKHKQIGPRLIEVNVYTTLSEDRTGVLNGTLKFTEEEWAVFKEGISDYQSRHKAVDMRLEEQ